MLWPLGLHRMVSLEGCHSYSLNTPWVSLLSLRSDISRYITNQNGQGFKEQNESEAARNDEQFVQGKYFLQKHVHGLIPLSRCPAVDVERNVATKSTDNQTR